MLDAGSDEVAGYGSDVTARQRLLTRLAGRRRGDKGPIGDRLRSAFLKPPKPGSPQVAEQPKRAEELSTETKSANDKERLIGLFAAPWAGGLAIVITNALIAKDPASTLANGLPNKLHVSISLYHEAELALLALALLMLVSAWLRKRLYLGILMALYGLTVFNLHYWGFGIPFLMVGAWYMVRAFRIQRSLRDSSGEPRQIVGSGMGSTGSARVVPPRASKRYTPPVSRSRR
jgi:hypothetical protein